MSLAKNSARSLGYPDLPMVVVPHPFETISDERARAIADEKFDEIVAAVSKSKEAIARA